MLTAPYQSAVRSLWPLLGVVDGIPEEVLTVPYQSAVRSLWSPPRYSSPLSVDPELRLQHRQTVNKLGTGRSFPSGTQKIKWVNLQK